MARKPFEFTALFYNEYKGTIRMYGNTVILSIDRIEEPTPGVCRRIPIDVEIHPSDSLREVARDLQQKLIESGSRSNDPQVVSETAIGYVEREFGWFLRNVQTSWPTLKDLKRYYGYSIFGQVVQVTKRTMGVILTIGGPMTTVQLFQIRQGRFFPRHMVLLNDRIEVFPLGTLEDMDIPLVIRMK